MSRPYSGSAITRWRAVLADARTADDADPESFDAAMLIGAAAEQLRFWPQAIQAYDRAAKLDPPALGPGFRKMEIEAARVNDSFDLQRLHNYINTKAQSLAQAARTLSRHVSEDVLFGADEEVGAIRTEADKVLTEIQIDLRVLMGWFVERANVESPWHDAAQRLVATDQELARTIEEWSLVLKIGTGSELRNALEAVAFAVDKVAGQQEPQAAPDQEKARNCRALADWLVQQLETGQVRPVNVEPESVIESVLITCNWADVVVGGSPRERDALRRDLRRHREERLVAAGPGQSTDSGLDLVAYAEVKAEIRLAEIAGAGDQRVLESLQRDLGPVPPTEAGEASSGATAWARRFDPALFLVFSERTTRPAEHEEPPAQSGLEVSKSKPNLVVTNRPPEPTPSKPPRQPDWLRGSATQVSAIAAITLALIAALVFSGQLITIVRIVLLGLILIAPFAFVFWLYVACRLDLQLASFKSGPGQSETLRQTRDRLMGKYEKYAQELEEENRVLAVLAVLAGAAFFVVSIVVDRTGVILTLLAVLLAGLGYTATAVCDARDHRQSERERLVRIVDQLNERYLRYSDSEERGGHDRPST